MTLLPAMWNNDTEDWHGVVIDDHHMKIMVRVRAESDEVAVPEELAAGTVPPAVSMEIATVAGGATTFSLGITLEDDDCEGLIAALQVTLDRSRSTGRRR